MIFAPIGSGLAFLISPLPNIHHDTFYTIIVVALVKKQAIVL